MTDDARTIIELQADLLHAEQVISEGAVLVADLNAHRRRLTEQVAQLAAVNAWLTHHIADQ